MAIAIDDANRRDEIFGVHPPECLTCCLRILTSPAMQSARIDTATIPTKAEAFFGLRGNSLHFESTDECHPNNEMLKLQRKLKRMNNPNYKAEFERWILQLYLRRCFSVASHFFNLPLTITKNDEKKQGHPDFLCQESGQLYGLEVTISTTEQYQKELKKLINDRKKGLKSALVWKTWWGDEPQRQWARHTAAAIIGKTNKLRKTYSKNGFRVCDLIGYSFPEAPLDPEDLHCAHKKLMEIIENDSDMPDASQLFFRRISIVGEGWAILDILGMTPTFLPDAISTF
jgi:hypothetical protein